MNCSSTRPYWRSTLAAALAAISVHGTAAAADIDIYGSSGAGDVPNVLFYLDNTANWSSQAQGWVPKDSWDKCVTLDEAAQLKCQDAIKKIFYVGAAAGQKYPWENGYNETYWRNNKLPQGVAELRALKLVLKALVCDVVDDPTTTSIVEKPLPVNVGVALFTPTKGSALSSGDAVAIIHHAVQRLTGTSTTGTCGELLGKLDTIDAKINDPEYKAPADANYGAALYEVFKYFGGYTNPTLATAAVSKAGSPVGATGYGPARFSKPDNPLDDPKAFLPGSPRTTYVSPITANGACGNNYIVFVGNTYPNNEPSGPPRFGGLNYTPPQLSLLTSDTKRFADEWSYFLSNTDVSDVDGKQRVFTYAVNVYNDKADDDQTKLMKSMAAVGGVGPSAYIEVGGDLYKLVSAFEDMLLEMAAIDSVFTATTLPVSTTTQGTFLNQVFVGMFRPDAQYSPRWVGNVKQYQLGLVDGSLELLDASSPDPRPAVSSGFFSPLARSFWTTDSVFFTNLPSGTPASASDSPDGAIVEKGGVAQLLRQNNITSSAARKVYTLPAAAGASLSSSPFDTTNSTVTAVFGNDTAGAAAIAWVRGEANVISGDGMEDFVGAWKDGTTVKDLGTTGARHSIHGDVLHSRPVAINYGADDVVVYYGANDGMFRAIDGRKSGSTAGHELWAFVAPEHFGLLKRQRAGAPRLHLPETDSNGQPVAGVGDAQPKDYAFDGPIGSYVLYKSGGTAVSEAFIYASMRRGGRSVYAFDVTSKTDPKLLWKIDPTDATDPKSTDYAALGQTWSMAKPIVYKSSSGSPPVVVVMGGGYDPAEDNNLTSGVGNRIYFINGRTGALLKAVTTTYSVPGDVTVVDTTPDDGIPDRAYAVDVRGNVYRIDLPTSGVITDSTTWGTTQAVKIAELGGKVFFAPDVIVTKSYVAVMVGTGDREKPLLNSKIDGTDAAEGFFLIKDTLGTPRPSALKRSDLALIAEVDKDTMLPVPTDKVGNENGCYMTLASNGEKVVNAATTIAGVTYFGTNRPAPTGALVCRADLGEAYAYKFPLFCKAPTNAKLDRGGLPPSPVAGIVEISVNGKPTKLPFIIGGGKGGSSFNPEEPKPVVAPIRRRQFWYIDNANR